MATTTEQSHTNHAERAPKSPHDVPAALLERLQTQRTAQHGQQKGMISVNVRMKLGLLSLLPLWYCLQSQAQPSLIGQYTKGNDVLAAQIAELPDEQILAEERHLAPQASDMLRSLKPLIREGADGLSIQDHLLAQFKAKGWHPMLVGYSGYPAAIAVSVNDGVLNGFPSDKPFPKAALVTIELVSASPRAHVAQAWTFATPDASEEQKALLEAAHKALRSGIEQVGDGAYIEDIGEAMQQVLDDYRVQPIAEYSGYTMGQKRIQPPWIIGYRNNYPTHTKMKKGQVLNIYAMANNGNERRTRLNTANFLEVFTVDGRDSVVLSAMVEVTADGYRMLSGFVE
ncbi:M24 family metallopeptidase [Pseudomonas sp. EggHat1]|uniref:M24 family metallopeptidase n=1 Tax=Pseudomonas sp. EggHat1 TaxID=2761624 RepID=UPI00299F5909|nr:M24 family metallopeptidase [Pseudomonas sp. EggHat1]